MIFVQWISVLLLHHDRRHPGIDAGPDFSDLRMYFVGQQDRNESVKMLEDMPIGTFLIRDGSRGLAISTKVVADLHFSNFGHNSHRVTT